MVNIHTLSDNFLKHTCCKEAADISGFLIANSTAFSEVIIKNPAIKNHI